MAPVPSKLYSDDVSLIMVLIDTNPFFWSTASLPFSTFLSHVLAFLNSMLLVNQLNQVVVIATGCNSCHFIFDSSSVGVNPNSENGRMPAVCSNLLQKLEEFVTADEKLSKEAVPAGIGSSLLSGSLSMALCYIQRVFRSGPLHPQPRGSPDGPEQYVAVMNAIFSAQRSMVPIDSCVIGAQNSAFLQQASYITEGVYLKPPLPDGLFQYLMTVFATECIGSLIPSWVLKGLYLQLICILAAFYNFLCLQQWIFVPRVFAIKMQLIWATYVLSVSLYFVSITRNVRPVGPFLVKPNLMPTQQQAIKERLQRHNFAILMMLVLLFATSPCCLTHLSE